MKRRVSETQYCIVVMYLALRPDRRQRILATARKLYDMPIEMARQAVIQAQICLANAPKL